MGSLRLVGSLKLWVSLQNVGLFCRALLQKRPIDFKEPTNRSHPIVFMCERYSSVRTCERYSTTPRYISMIYY